MPNHTIYLPLGAEYLWERVQIQSGESMSSLFLQFLRDRFEPQEDEEILMGKMMGSAQPVEVFRSLRAELAVSQSELAALMGTTQTSVARWETGAQPISAMVMKHLMLLRDNHKLDQELQSIMARKKHVRGQEMY